MLQFDAKFRIKSLFFIFFKEGVLMFIDLFNEPSEFDLLDGSLLVKFFSAGNDLHCPLTLDGVHQ